MTMEEARVQIAGLLEQVSRDVGFQITHVSAKWMDLSTSSGSRHIIEGLMFDSYTDERFRQKGI